jgi:hypothetical protein
VFPENHTEIRLWSDAADGRIVVLESAPTISAPGWQPIATNILLSGFTAFNAGAIDAAKSSQQFYRAVLR